VPAKKLIIATRKSPLALTQTEMIIRHLSRHLPDHEFEMLKLSTTGDRQRDWSLQKEGGKGLFTSELEEALRRGEADLAMHSTKDLPTDMSDELALAGFLPRDDARDVVVLRKGITSPAVLASGSPRRRAQAEKIFPEVRWQEIRGNVDTRLRKIADGEADGTILALAGLNRLGIREWPGLEFRTFSTEEMVPAVGQGAVAVQCRAEDAGKYAPLLDEATRLAVTAERSFLSQLGGGCHTAFAAHYRDGVLEIFHENIGYRRYCLPELTLDEVDLAIGAIVKDIS
jgi:hydroxymethylbilane synthase